ncbi:cytoskeletal protein CcmA (bactofilin family) [Paraburkholderia sp. Clong3]|uniref:hypothetical protein n=1 Tax=Paraburkholderia sp. Clong3 TaxID=2991061 RepID=UPI003D24F9F2
MSTPSQPANPDRLYELLPVIHQLRDAERGYPLRALLQVISEQVNGIDADIARLYDNWFIETCDEWVVPYIGALVGYVPLNNPNDLANPATTRGLAEESLLIPRQEVANTIHYRRRKGTLSLLEDLARAVGGWPAKAVEFYRLLSVTQNISYLQPGRGRTANLRDGDALDDLGGPFDELAHTVDVRRIDSHRGRGRFNIPEVGVFVWRIKPYTVTRTPACCLEEVAPNCFTFSVLGNDSPLYTLAQPAAPGVSPTPLNLPEPITRRRLARLETGEDPESSTSGIPSYYGPNGSFTIWVGTPPQPVPPGQIVAADLSGWSYRPLPNTVAVDPELGRIAFPHGQPRKQGVWVSYVYGFSADIGGGEYDRPISQPAGAAIYRVGENEAYGKIGDALARWTQDQPADAVVEIADSGVYVEPISITLKAKQTLQLRAANGTRPVIRLLDWQTSAPDDLTVSGEAGSWFVLDGLLVTGRGVQVDGDIAGVVIRHSTLVPGWGLECDCKPRRPTDASLDLIDSPDCLTIEHSIVGAIQVDRNEAKKEPGIIRISDSIVDATANDQPALGAPQSLCAYVTVTIARSTVFGQVAAHAIELAENSIFMGSVLVCRRQEGCVRFCYVAPGSRTPRRYECQPDGVLAAVSALYPKGDIDAEERDRMQAAERLRVEPEFTSSRYGTPTYCQFATACACEIKSGADDESEMGVFHDLYQPQRASNLMTRLAEYSPAGFDAGILFAS